MNLKYLLSCVFASLTVSSIAFLRQPFSNSMPVFVSSSAIEAAASVLIPANPLAPLMYKSFIGRSSSHPISPRTSLKHS